MLRETKKNFLIDLAFFLTIAAIIYVAFKFLAVYLFPFVIGLVITVIVQKPANFVSKHLKINKGICAMIFVILTYIAVVGLISLIIYLLYSVGARFVEKLPGILGEVTASVGDFGRSVDGFMSNMPVQMQSSFSGMLDSFVETITATLTEFVSGIATSIAFSTPEFIVVSIVTVVASCYIAKDIDKLKASVKGFVKQEHYDIASEVKHIIYDNVFKILKGYLIIMFITFCELCVGLLIIRVPSAILIAMLIAVVDILPILGCGTVLIPWGIISLIRGDILLGISILILYIVILVIRNIIEPKIIGDRVGIHPLITLTLIFIGLRLMGVIGMFILPILAIVIIELYKKGKLDFLHFGEKETAKESE